MRRCSIPLQTDLCEIGKVGLLFKTTSEGTIMVQLQFHWEEYFIQGVTSDLTPQHESRVEYL